MLRRNLGVAAVIATGGLLAASGPASAQTGNPFDCSASTANVSLAGTTILAPTTANPAVSPCASDSATLAPVTVPSRKPGLSGAVGPVDSQTTLSRSRVSGATVYTEANATTTVDAATIDIAGNTISIGPSTATVDDACQSDALQASASSTLNAITVNGTTYTLSGSPQTLNLLPGVATIAVNQRTTSGDDTTETLLNVGVLGGLAGGADITVGTATAGASSEACAGTSGVGTGTGGGGGGGGTGTGGGGSGGGGSSSTCPSGATASAGKCVVAGTNIAVPSTASHDITGGRVISLAAARRRFGKHTACLNGAGPKWIVVGTKRANQITVRKIRMRVLGFAGKDRLTVVGGNRTCVNGGSGNDRIVNRKKNFVTAFGANGNDRITLGNGRGFVLGGKGNDRIVSGNGRVDLQGNAGRDYIKVGNGAARLNGGNGNDTLIAGTGRAHLNGGKGRNRITAHGKVAYVSANPHSRSVAYVRRGAASYARHHGVKTVHVIRGHGKKSHKG